MTNLKKFINFKVWFTSALTLLLVVAPVVAEGVDSVALGGRIFQPDGATPFQAATVRVTNQETGEVFSAQPTGVDGSYSFAELPPGTYTFEVEVAEGIYKLDRAVRIGADETASISFTVKPEPVAPVDAPKKAGGKKLGKGGLTAIIAGGAALVAVAASGGGDSKASPQASPFTP